jgi:outer membrane protein OmpA-like peptidoglycan-associated protein
VVPSGLVGVKVLLMASTVLGQQPVQVIVTAVPNPVPAGACTGIWVEVRDGSGQRLANVDGIQLYNNSYDYSVANATDFAWKNNDPASGFLCARAGAGQTSSPVTAVIRGTTRVGSTVVAIQPAPGSQTGATAVASPQPTPVQSAQSGPPTPGQPYVPPPATGSQGVPASQPDPAIAAAVAPQPTQTSPPSAGQGYAPSPAAAYQPAAAPAPAATGYQPSTAPAPQAVPASVPAVQSAAPPQEEKGGGGFLKKFGKHIKEKASQVTSATAQNLASSATQLVDTTLQSGSGLVTGTVAGVSNAAQVTVGGAGKSLLPSALRMNGSSDNLTLALGSGRAVLRAMRFDPATGQLTPPSLALAQRVAAELRQSPAKWVVEAYVDPAPGDQELSEYRAAVVKTALIHYGVPRESLTALGYGPSKLEPEAPADGGPATRAHIDIAKRE